MEKSLVRRRHSAFAAGLATVAMALGFTAIPADAAPPPRDVDYVALGDSYTAGTGAVAFLPTASCVRNDQGYVNILDGTDPVNLVDNAACHGALIQGEAQPGLPGVLDQIARLAASGNLSKDTELVSITAGANDVGVNTVIFNCATSTQQNCNQAVLAAEAALPDVHRNLVAAFAAIHSQAPRARIVVLGYSKLFNTAGAPVIPVDRQMAINDGTTGLNQIIASAADTANTLYGAHVQYVDVTARFEGHEANTTSQWIVFDPTNPFTPESFHPNPAGHQAYADALLASVNLKQLARP
jgi:lysophospholipase L1-like esterase